MLCRAMKGKTSAMPGIWRLMTQPQNTYQVDDFAMQAQEDEELARAIAASLGDDASAVPAQRGASSAPAQPAGISARPRAAARGQVEAGDVASSAASEPTSQPARIGTLPYHLLYSRNVNSRTVA